jgi:hypothetical protein
MNDRIPRNEAIEIIGKEQFVDAWVGEMTTSEWELVRAHKARFADGTKPSAEIAEQLYQAEERAARSDRQHREVIQWLENHGLDCVRGLRDGFDRDTFETTFARVFGRSSLPRNEPEPLKPEPLKIKFRIASDGPLILEAVQAVLDGKATSAYQAAKLVYQTAEGNSPEANLDRLRKLIGRELKARGWSPIIANHRQ